MRTVDYIRLIGRLKKIFVVVLIIAFLGTMDASLSCLKAQEIFLPMPGARVVLSPPFEPAIIKGITIHPENPFQFDFIMDAGADFMSARNQGPTQGQPLRMEASKLIKYFLASLTIPEKDLWVNLSPYEKDRIIPKSFGRTEMGRDVLAEDYILKQITASLLYPEGQLGKGFWKRVYLESYRKFGTTDIPVNTFNKVWIIPDKASVYENGNTAFVIKSHLKVMLEEDYLALQKQLPLTPSLTKEGERNMIPPLFHKEGVRGSSNIIRQIVIPALTKEVNEGKNFAPLRQINNSLILATWFKKRLKESLLGRIYVDKAKVKGIDQDPAHNWAIYQRYLKAYQKGVYNYIKEDEDRDSHVKISRKYFSGGWSVSVDGKTSFAQVVDIKTKTTISSADLSQLLREAQGPHMEEVAVYLQASSAMTSNRPQSSMKLIIKEGTDKYQELLERQDIDKEQFLSSFLSALEGAICKHYMELGSVWDQELLPLHDALSKNGFYQDMEVIRPLLVKYITLRVAPLGQREKSRDLDFNHLNQKEGRYLSQAIDFLRKMISQILEEYREGRIQWPGLRFGRLRKTVLQMHRGVSHKTVEHIVSAIAVALLGGFALPHYMPEEWWHQWEAYSYLKEFVLGVAVTVPLNIIFIKRMSDGIKQRAARALGDYYESVLWDK
ncbi:MAG: hypothetical protein HQL13_03140, partial [Candidatus Omnitrophica bacterium]|nr:hypothetical protein [Candidatus Omnitrophota bacterium]